MIGERLKQLRIDLNITLEKVAEDLKVTTRAIRSYERGERDPSKKYLQYLNEMFNVNINWILNGQEPVFFDKNENKEFFEVFKAHFKEKFGLSDDDSVVLIKAIEDVGPDLFINAYKGNPESIAELNGFIRRKK